MLVLASAVPVAAARGLSPGKVAGGLIVLATVSGIMWTQINVFMWQVPRLATEQSTYGATVSELISRQRPTDSVQRPARTGPPAGYTSDTLTSREWNGAYFSEQLTVGG